MTQIEYNFPLFFGLAVQAYERTLISNQSPYDRWARAGFFRSTTILSASQLRGFDIFMNLGQTPGMPQGRCIACHKGPEFTNAASFLQRENPIERMLMEGNVGLALYDTGFYNIGVVPTPNDQGIGGRDPFGNELSFTHQFRTVTSNGFGVNVDDLALGRIGNPNVNPIFIDPCRFDFPFSPVDPVTGECDRTVLTDAQSPVLAEHEAAVNGAFKTPTLRNAELTGPYMHNGGMKSLREVVDFYNRGGNFNNFGLDADIEPIGMTAAQKVDLVNFLRALTDPRVRQERGPFDHPSLRVFQGHPSLP
jgi:cytochrome c peroxidase